MLIFSGKEGWMVKIVVEKISTSKRDKCKEKIFLVSPLKAYNGSQ